MGWFLLICTMLSVWLGIRGLLGPFIASALVGCLSALMYVMILVHSVSELNPF